MTEHKVYPLGKHESRETTYVPLWFPYMPLHNADGTELVGWLDMPDIGELIREHIVEQEAARLFLENYEPIPSPPTIERVSLLARTMQQVAMFVGLMALMGILFTAFIVALVLVAGLIGAL